MKIRLPLPSLYIVRAVLAAGCLGILGCATPLEQPRDAKFAVAEKSLKDARSTAAPTGQRIALYLEAAANSAPLIGSGPGSAPGAGDL